MLKGIMIADSEKLPNVCRFRENAEKKPIEESEKLPKSKKSDCKQILKRIMIEQQETTKEEERRLQANAMNKYSDKLPKSDNAGFR